MDAAVLGGAVVAILTQLVALVAGRVGVALPRFVKQLIAFLLASGVVNLSTLHPFAGVVLVGIDVTAILNGLVVWAAALFLHDLAGAAQAVNVLRKSVAAEGIKPISGIPPRRPA